MEILSKENHELPEPEKSPWPIPQPRLATYIMLFFMVILWPAFYLLFLFPGQYEINYELMDPVLFIFLPTMVIEWFIVFCIALVLWRENATSSSLGLVRPKLLDIPVGIGAFIFLYIFFAVLQILFAFLGLTIDDNVGFLVAKGSNYPGWWLALSFTAAFCEEVAFRGFLITRLRAVIRGGWFWPLVISALAFGCGHSYQGLGGLILLTLLGTLLGGLFLWRRSLWPVIITHFIIDISAIYIFKLSRTLGP